MRIFKNLFKYIRPFVRDLDVRIDRTRQTITFERHGHFEVLTVDQLFDEIESMFNVTRALERTDRAPGAERTIAEKPQEKREMPILVGTWLTNCENPIANPLKMIDQAVTEPTRPLAAYQAEDRGPPG